MNCPTCGSSMRTLNFLMTSPWHCDKCDSGTRDHSDLQDFSGYFNFYSYCLNSDWKKLSPGYIFVIWDVDLFITHHPYENKLLILLTQSPLADGAPNPDGTQHIQFQSAEVRDVVKIDDLFNKSDRLYSQIDIPRM